MFSLPTLLSRVSDLPPGIIFLLPEVHPFELLWWGFKVHSILLRQFPVHTFCIISFPQLWAELKNVVEFHSRVYLICWQTGFADVIKLCQQLTLNSSKRRLFWVDLTYQVSPFKVFRSSQNSERSSCLPWRNKLPHCREDHLASRSQGFRSPAITNWILPIPVSLGEPLQPRWNCSPGWHHDFSLATPWAEDPANLYPDSRRTETVRQCMGSFKPLSVVTGYAAIENSYRV